MAKAASAGIDRSDAVARVAMIAAIANRRCRRERTDARWAPPAVIVVLINPRIVLWQTL